MSFLIISHSWLVNEIRIKHVCYAKTIICNNETSRIEATGTRKCFAVAFRGDPGGISKLDNATAYIYDLNRSNNCWHDKHPFLKTCNNSGL